jgi:pimeloyl-ACP methyl ester carboxylesterase
VTADTSPGERAIAFRTLGGPAQEEGATAQCLLLHGFGSDRLSWLGTVPALFPVVRVHAVDLPGHGESGMTVDSGAPQEFSARIEAVLTERVPAPVHIIAHSLGGAVALDLAQRRPDLVASLVLIAPAGLGVGVDQNFLADFAALADGETATRVMQRLVMRPAMIGKQTVAYVLAQLKRDGARAALQQIAAALPAAENALYTAALTANDRALPRLTIWGEQDRINPLNRDKLSAFGGALHLEADCGHLPHIEAARTVNARIVTFLQSVMAR